MQLLPTVFDSKAITSIYDPNDCIGLLEIVSPVGAESLLASDIPFVQLRCIREAPAKGNDAHRYSRCICSEASYQSGQLCQSTHLPCPKVLMLNPSVGLIPVISSPFSRLRIVVLPALSRPLNSTQRESHAEPGMNPQKQQPHFAFFPPIFPDDCKQPHEEYERYITKRRLLKFET